MSLKADGKLAKGQFLLGHERLRPTPSVWKKIKGVLAMVRIAVLG